MSPKTEEEALRGYRPFVVKMARKFKRGSIQSEDLIQEGLLAVALAFREWRQEGGSNFLTWIRRPVFFAMLKLAREAHRAGGNMRGMGRGPQGKEYVWLDSLDAPRHGAVEDTLYDDIGTFEEPADPFVRGKLADLVSGLSKIERRVIRLRFQDGVSYADVGRRLSLSKETVRQIEQTALAQLGTLASTLRKSK